MVVIGDFLDNARDTNGEGGKASLYRILPAKIRKGKKARSSRYDAINRFADTYGKE